MRLRLRKTSANASCSTRQRRDALTLRTINMATSRLCELATTEVASSAASNTQSELTTSTQRSRFSYLSNIRQRTSRRFDRRHKPPGCRSLPGGIVSPQIRRGIMFGGNQLSDKELLKTVSKRLQRGGVAGLTADIRQGTVTLKGKIRYETQRPLMLKIVNSIAGVRRVVDQIRLEPRRPC